MADQLDFLLKLFALIMPYFLIKSTFRLGGAAMAALSGNLNKMGGGFMGGLRKRRGDQMGKTFGEAREGNRFTGNAFGRRASRSIQTATLAPKVGVGGLINPSKGRARVQDARSKVNTQARMRDIEKGEATQAVRHDDDLLTAMMTGGGDDMVRQSLYDSGQRGRELNQSVASVMAARKELGNNYMAAGAVMKAGTGTGYNDVDEQGRHIGHGLLTQDILTAANGDRAMERNLVAATKSAANGARRYDIGGAGFGANLTAIEDLRNGRSSIAEVSANLQDSSLDAQGAGAILGGRADSVQPLVQALQRRTANSVNNLVQAHQTGDQQMIETAQRRLVQDVASTEAVVDVAPQASPEAARLISDGVLGQRLNLAAVGTASPDARDWLATRGDGTRMMGDDISVRQLMDHLASATPADNPMDARHAYGEMRRNYQSSYQNDLARQRAQAGLGGAPQTNIPQNPGNPLAP